MHKFATIDHARVRDAAFDLLDALIMVQNADEDCRRDGFATIPPTARARIDAALSKALAKKIPCGECHLRPGQVCDICGARRES